MLKEDNGKLLAQLEKYREKAKRRKDERLVPKEELEEIGNRMKELQDEITEVRQENEELRLRLVAK